MNYIVIYGKCQERGLSCYKETIISELDIKKFDSVFKLIKEHENDDINWAWGIELIDDFDINTSNEHNYHEHYRIEYLYPNFTDFNLLDEFAYKYLPNNITKIESIKIYEGEKYKIL